MKLQKKVQDLTALLSSKDDFIKELRVKDSLLRKHQERVQRLKEECEACGRELKRCKDENYDLAMRLARQSEEKGAALMRNRDLQLEVPSAPRASGQRAAGGGGQGWWRTPLRGRAGRSCSWKCPLVPTGVRAAAQGGRGRWWASFVGPSRGAAGGADAAAGRWTGSSTA